MTVNGSTSPHQGTPSDPDDTSLVSAVVAAVAGHRGVDPVDLPPLYEQIDPDALDALFRPAGDGVVPGSVRFQFADCVVEAFADGGVEVESLADD